MQPDQLAAASLRKKVLYAAGAGLACTLLLLQLGPGAAEAVEPVRDLEPAVASEQLEMARPQELYIVIDTALNRLYLKQKEDVLLEALCSTGSGLILETPEKTWHFRTPRGVFQIESKTRNPVWRKPDWAFLEEGLPIPTRESERFERNVLGEYALGIGDGYFIHGTLYTRLLGTNVTHGCIRVGEGDLEKLANSVPLGTKVYIF